MGPAQKLSNLKSIIRDCDSLLVAFSGGVDSAFILKTALEVLPKKRVLAVTADSPTYPREELLFSRALAAELGARHLVIRTRELEDRNFVSNPHDRCYYCKLELFLRLKEIASRFKLNFVADGSSVSDASDFRPGTKAKQELGIRSPLLEAGFTKGDIRNFSRKMGLSAWDKPSLACLASRIPYGTKISPDLLKRVNCAEKYLRGLGFEQVRVRHYGDLCRIEVSAQNIQRLVSRHKQVVDNLKKLGYNYVTVDLEGYRTGSMNEVIKK